MGVGALTVRRQIHLLDSADTGTVSPQAGDGAGRAATAGPAASTPRLCMIAACRVTAIFLPSESAEPRGRLRSAAPAQEIIEWIRLRHGSTGSAPLSADSPRSE